MGRYENKYFSVLGDSLSTLEGYSVPKYAAFYDTARKLEAEVYIPSDTWWGKVIRHFDGRLLVNNSFSGSTVCWSPGYEIQSYGCSEERTSSLGKDGILPDVIMVLMGTNDWGKGTKPMPDGGDSEDLSVFLVAYSKMLEKLKNNYPQAEIWCFTLPVSKCTKDPEFVFPYCYKGIHIEKYCEVIRKCANEKKCRIVDFYAASEPYDTIDRFHPNAQGMKTLAKAAIDQLEERGNEK